MNENSKPFFSAFPNLIMDEKYRELLPALREELLKEL